MARQGETGPPKGPLAPFAEFAVRGARATSGERGAAEVERRIARQDAAAAVTAAKRRQAAAIGARRAARGEGRELQEDRPTKPLRGSQRREREKSRRASKRTARTDRRLRQTLQARRLLDGEREVAAAEAMAERALETTGMRGHFRPIARVAWFAAYMAGCDRNGAVALRVLQSVNMPADRICQVMRAAFEPRGHQPRRDVCSGGRASQQRYRFDDRELAKRTEEHPGAIRVIQCAVFLWLSKSRTRRRGYMGRVHGFGRGVFGALCRCGKDALTGHDRGIPGALVALRQAGFIEYGQPPATVVSGSDVGPSGHAYNVYWLKSDAASRALDAWHQDVARIARLPLLARLLQTPALLASKPAPAAIDPADIPF